MNETVIGADHEFHDRDFALAWSERFSPTAQRLELFELVLGELRAAIPAHGRVVELGIGPVYLANHILQAMSDISYCSIDFSTPMLDIARARLERYASRITYLQADLVDDDWQEAVAGPVDAVISTWALHDLGSQQNVQTVYAKSAGALRGRGILLNGDFIRPDGATQVFEAGRFEVARHLELMRQTGFKHAKCLALLEHDLESPTSAKNYACLKALRRMNP